MGRCVHAFNFHNRVIGFICVKTSDTIDHYFIKSFFFRISCFFNINCLHIHAGIIVKFKNKISIRAVINNLFVAYRSICRRLHFCLCRDKKIPFYKKNNLSHQGTLWKFCQSARCKLESLNFFIHFSYGVFLAFFYGILGLKVIIIYRQRQTSSEAYYSYTELYFGLFKVALKHTFLFRW